ncbi:flavin monoamine oxidase family protein [Pseudonocardia eucalypti]|uniref:Flavin monoamine oxidase family protein n=2 Tax=Pseudonocardia eucalypti TaxID=648755 RepID=A0ABP9QFT2_9PSEU
MGVVGSGMISRTGTRPRDGRITIAVLGAGIAGLVAGYELERLGYDVVILEADSRLGGRVFTHHFGGPGGPLAELGAMRIPADHHLTVRYVNELGLRDRLRPFRGVLSEPHNYLRTGSRLVRVRDAAAPLIREVERFAGGGSHRRETLLFVGWLRAMVHAIAPQELRDSFRDDVNGIFGPAGRLDLAPFLRGDRADLAGAFDTYPELRDACGGRLEGFLGDLLRESGAHMLTLEGGMDQLVVALAARLRGPIHTRHEVVGLDVRPDAVTCHLVHAGSRSTVTWPAVLCTIPFSVLRGLRLTGVDADKLDVIGALDYGSATKVALHCREAFWIADGITGGGSALEGLSRQTYYPDAVVDGGSALLAGYAIAEDADRLGQLSESDRLTAVVDEVAAAHPGLRRPGMVRDAIGVVWGERRWSRGGVARRWGVTNAQRAREVERATRPQGGLFFAGEHCATSPAWINAAMESALRAVTRIDAFARRPATARIGAEVPG